MMPPRRLSRVFFAFGSDERGNSAVEFALWLTLLAIPTLNVVDLGFYIFQTMQVREAAQAGAQIAESVCGYNGYTPVATKCQSSTPSLSDLKILGAARSTSLANGITFATVPTEGWYCNDTTGALVLAKDNGGTVTTTWNANGGTAVTQPTDCSKTITGDTDAPGDYVFVSVKYTYTPMLPSVSLISVLRTTAVITQTGWMRIG